jgi:hypothetical protein
MKRLLLLPLLLAATLRAQDAQPKTAEEILSIVRRSYALQNHKMNGQLRDDATGRTEPLTLTMENQLMGEGRVSAQKCWIVRVTNPGKDGPYYVVDIYVHHGSGGAAKMEAYDRNSKVVKRYQVNKVQKVDNATVLKELKIETVNPFNGEIKGRTYMTLDNPEKK